MGRSFASPWTEFRLFPDEKTAWPTRLSDTEIRKIPRPATPTSFRLCPSASIRFLRLLLAVQLRSLFECLGVLLILRWFFHPTQVDHSTGMLRRRERTAHSTAAGGYPSRFRRTQWRLKASGANDDCEGSHSWMHLRGSAVLGVPGERVVAIPFVQLHNK